MTDLKRVAPLAQELFIRRMTELERQGEAEDEQASLEEARFALVAATTFFMILEVWEELEAEGVETDPRSLMVG